MKKLINKIPSVKNLKEMLLTITSQNEKTISLQNEQLKADIFLNSIANCEWVSDKKFYPGRWAVDFSFLYTLFRILDEIKPQKILEFGLGQSSKLVQQFGNFHKENYVITCEHDAAWIDFFKKGFSQKANIKQLELETINYKGFKTLTYKNIKQEFENQKFNLILIDAPFGSEHYSRSQILELIPNILEQSFCILLDDYNRIGEQETAQEMQRILTENNIKYFHAIYHGDKKHFLLCSEDLKFLSSM
ncbi:MAG: hypothetical protein FWC39_00160 [Bacteroidetes bacterium]|nr:hypothetical protein [Bacteroidota bacterium]